MRQRNVHLTCPETPLPHVVLDYRVLAGKLVLRSQALVYPLRRVSLLPRKTAVILQYPVDHTPVRVQLGPARRRSSTIPGRRRVLQHLAHRVPVQSEHPRRLPSAHTIHHAGPAHPRVHLHLVHPSHFPSSCSQLYGRRRAVPYYSATSLRRHTPARSIITPAFTPRHAGTEGGCDGVNVVVALSPGVMSSYAPMSRYYCVRPSTLTMRTIGLVEVAFAATDASILLLRLVYGWLCSGSYSDAP